MISISTDIHRYNSFLVLKSLSGEVIFIDFEITHYNYEAMDAAYSLGCPGVVLQIAGKLYLFFVRLLVICMMSDVL